MVSGKPTALILLDLSAAFDIIDHNTLLDSPTFLFGMWNTASKWFNSNQRKLCQAIKVHSTLSEVCELIYEVPVLGSLLFSSEQSSRRHSGIKFHFYADVNQIFVHLSENNVTSIFDKMNDVQEIGCLLAN